MSRVDERVVYIIDVGEYTKIGYASDPNARRSVIQSHNPTPVTLVGTIETDDAPRLESTLHARLAEHRCQSGGGGEWFDLPDDIHKALADADYLASTTLSENPTPHESWLEGRRRKRRERRDRRMKRRRTPLTKPNGEVNTCTVSGCTEPADAVTVLDDSTIEGARDALSDEWLAYLLAEDRCALCFANAEGYAEHVDESRLDDRRTSAEEQEAVSER